MAKAKAKTTAAIINLSLLASLVAAGTSGMFMAASDSAALTAHTPPLAEVNTEIKDANGNLATRATQAGIDYAAAHPVGSAPANVVVEEKVKPTFKIVTTVLPEIKRGHSGAATSIYPFDDLPAATKDAASGQIAAPSFFIPASDERPEPAKALASTVSSATRRWAVQDKAKPKKTVMRVPEGAPEGAAKVAVEIDNMIPTRQFVIRAVEDGKPWGEEFAGKKGAAVYRIDLGEAASA
jgi:hypothetical protein